MAERNFDKTILSSDDKVKFDFMTSLQNIVIAKIISNLWMDRNNIKDIISFIHSGIRPGRRESSNIWQQIKNSIKTKTSELFLPKTITEKLNIIVPVVGNSTLNWIRYHECILNTREYSAVEQIKHIAWTARGKIDFTQTARNILADKDSCLCDDHKYKLACTYCLEDEIAVLAPNVVNQCYLDSVQIHMHPMVYFWTACITGDNTNLYNHYRDYTKLNNISINGYIIQLLINSNKRSCRTFNEVPIKYMWAKLSEEEKAKNVASMVKEFSNEEFRYTLLSNLDFEMQQEVFEVCSDTILFGILNDWLWREYFLHTALHFLDIMQPSSYFFILKEINKGMIKNSQEENKCTYNEYAYIFKQLWQGGSKNLKFFNFEHENYSFVKNLVFSLTWERDMDLIGLILNYLSAEKRKDIILRYHGLEQCVHFIKIDRWDLLDQFMNFTLSSDKDISELKKTLINSKGEKIAMYFLEQNTLDKIEHFMNWAFMSEGDVQEFRKNLAHIKTKTAVKSFISSNKIDFTNLENHFKWCAKEDPDMINQFKSEIPDHYPENVIEQFIRDEKYGLLDLFLNWCFSNNQIKVAQFKSNMYKRDDLTHCFGSLTLFLIRKDNSFELLDKFVHWCFIDEQQVQGFKMWALYPLEKFCSLCTDFLVENQFELADKFIKWCVTSDEEIGKFKKILMLSKDFTVIFSYCKNNDKQDLHSLIKWFNPSEEMVEAFKKVYLVEKCPASFYRLFDESLQNRNERNFIDMHNNSDLEISQNVVDQL